MAWAWRVDGGNERHTRRNIDLDTIVVVICQTLFMAVVDLAHLLELLLSHALCDMALLGIATGYNSLETLLFYKS